MTGRFGPVCLSLNFRSIASKFSGLSVGKQFATLSTPAFVFPVTSSGSPVGLSTPNIISANVIILEL